MTNHNCHTSLGVVKMTLDGFFHVCHPMFSRCILRMTRVGLRLDREINDGRVLGRHPGSLGRSSRPFLVPMFCRRPAWPAHLLRLNPGYQLRSSPMTTGSCPCALRRLRLLY